jgi:hypothetical protein
MFVVAGRVGFTSADDTHCEARLHGDDVEKI